MKKTAESILLILSLVCIALLPYVPAVRPPPVGHYLGGNTAFGASALLNNTIGGRNTAIGRSALSLNTTGSFNTANGYQALFNNTTGNFNIALGQGAGSRLTTGDSNIDIGAFGFPGESATIRIGEGQTKTLSTALGGPPWSVAYR